MDKHDFINTVADKLMDFYKEKIKNREMFSAEEVEIYENLIKYNYDRQFVEEEDYFWLTVAFAKYINLSVKLQSNNSKGAESNNEMS